MGEVKEGQQLAAHFRVSAGHDVEGLPEAFQGITVVLDQVPHQPLGLLIGRHGLADMDVIGLDETVAAVVEHRDLHELQAVPFQQRRADILQYTLAVGLVGRMGLGVNDLIRQCRQPGQRPDAGEEPGPFNPFQQTVVTPDLLLDLLRLEQRLHVLGLDRIALTVLVRQDIYLALHVRYRQREQVDGQALFLFEIIGSQELSHDARQGIALDRMVTRPVVAVALLYPADDVDQARDVPEMVQQGEDRLFVGHGAGGQVDQAGARLLQVLGVVMPVQRYLVEYGHILDQGVHYGQGPFTVGRAGDALAEIFLTGGQFPLGGLFRQGLFLAEVLHFPDNVLQP